MNKILIILAILFLLPVNTPAQGKTNVVVTIAPLAEFVEQIGGDRVSVTIMVPPGGNPHTYEPTPSQLKDLSRSPLYIKVGSGVEFELTWLDKIMAVNTNLVMCDSGKGVRLIGITDHLHHEKAVKDRHHYGNDPHIWNSLSNAIIMVGNIRDCLIKHDSAHEAEYRENANAYIHKLRELKKRIARELKHTPARKFMVFHPALGYFAADFDLIQISAETGGKEPSAKNITELIKRAKAENIKVIFAEPQFNTKSAEVIASAIGGQVVLINPLDKNYLQNMEKMAEALIRKLK